VSIFDCDEEMKKKTGYGKKIGKQRKIQDRQIKQQKYIVFGQRCREELDCFISKDRKVFSF
jgi:hypothetical protein